MKNLSRLSLLLAAVALTLTFFGCDNPASSDDGDTATVSGTVTLPASVTAKPYMVFVDTDDDPGNGFTKSASGTVTGTTFNYSIADVPAGTYYISAVVWVSGDGTAAPVAGDYYGINGNDPIAIDAGETKDVDLTLFEM